MFDFAAMPASAWLAATLMLVLAFLAFVPLVPGVLLIWLVALLYAWGTGFAVVGQGALIVISVLMLIGTTSDLWMRYLGLARAQKATPPTVNPAAPTPTPAGDGCTTTLVSIAGGLAGTFLIPIPVLGTLLGAMGGVFLHVLAVNQGNATVAWERAWGVFTAWLGSLMVEFATSIGMIVVFVWAALT